MALISEPLNEPPYDEPESIRMAEVLYPPAPDKGIAFDGGTDPYHRQFGFVAQRSWGNFASVVLWNPMDRSADVALAGVPLESLGRRFHVWSFWDEKYLGVADDSFIAKALPPHGCALLRLTTDDDRPAIVGSTLHLSMGSAEFGDIRTVSDQMEITLTDAGAREGKLFLHSRQPLALQFATGCNASLTLSAGDIWILSLSARQRGSPNSILLRISK